jgi:hypothetical protein
MEELSPYLSKILVGGGRTIINLERGCLVEDCEYRRRIVERVRTESRKRLLVPEGDRVA